MQGLRIPGDTPEFRLRLGEGRLDDTVQWPPPELVWLLAISQHYGIPTRLLDWSRKPLIACWFAAEEVAKDPTTNGRFIVWALKRRSGLLDRTPWTNAGAPRSEVPNLHLQSGVFVMRPVQPAELDRPVCTTSLCCDLEQRLTEPLSEVLRGASLPNDQARRMLEVLRDAFIQGVAVYGGFAGVARSVFEHRWRE